MPRQGTPNDPSRLGARLAGAPPVRGPWSAAGRTPDGDPVVRRPGPPRRAGTPRDVLLATRVGDDAGARLHELGGPLGDADPFEALAYACGVRGPVGTLAVRRSGIEADGVPVPVVDDAGLRHEVIALGEEILWLGTHGAVAHDARRRPYRDVGLPPSDPRRPWPIGPVREAPATMAHLRRLGVLIVGTGGFRRVAAGAVSYRVGGHNVLGAWFATRPDPAPGPGAPWPPARAAELEALLLVLNRLAALEDRRLELAAAVAAAAGRPPAPASGAAIVAGGGPTAGHPALLDLVRGDRPAGQSL